MVFWPGADGMFAGDRKRLLLPGFKRGGNQGLDLELNLFSIWFRRS